MEVAICYGGPLSCPLRLGEILPLNVSVGAIATRRREPLCLPNERPRGVEPTKGKKEGKKGGKGRGMYSLAAKWGMLNVLLMANKRQHSKDGASVGGREGTQLLSTQDSTATTLFHDPDYG